MTPLHRRTLRAIIITIIALVILAALYFTSRWIIRRFFSEPATPADVTAQRQIVDSDGDGLPDAFEQTYYGTDAANPDSDGDGTPDFAEIQAGRDPAVAGTSDLSDEIKPPTGSDVPDLGTYTNKYLAQLPSNVAREDILNQEQIEAFITAERGQLLPTITDSALVASTEAGPAAVEAYLNQVSASHNNELRLVTSEAIQAAFTKHLQQQPEEMNTIITQLEHNLDTVKKVPAPAETLELHRTTVAATQSLLANVKLLRDTTQDIIGSLLASKNIDDLGAIFQDIAAQVSQLEAKYELE